MSAELPDPLRFAVTTLEQLGALVDTDGGRTTALLPGEVAARLSLSEDIVLGEAAGEVGFGMGSPLLEALVEVGRSAAPCASASTSLLPPRDSAVRALAERFVVRNGVTSVASVTTEERTYLIAAVAWTVQADERTEGLVVGAIDPDGGGRPAVPFHLDPALAGEPRTDAVVLDPTAAPWIVRLATSMVEPVADGPLAAAARRQSREHDRIADYYRQLIAEARRPRRRVDPDAIAAKVSHLVAERDTRLSDLGHRYAATVTTRLAGVLALRLVIGRATLRVRRRKGERSLVLNLPPGARTFDAPPCDGCASWIDERGPVVCDGRLHLLCARCAPDATGRPRCPACGAS